MNRVTVREFARLTTESGKQSLDEHTVTPSAFNHLCELASGFKRSGARIGVRDGAQWLTLDQYVGVIETPCGTTVEILPKSASDADDAMACRELLRKMLTATMGLRSRDAGVANIDSLHYPLTEWVMQQFIDALHSLVRRGIRNEYHRVEEHARFLRGQLNMARQARQPVAQSHLFHIAHDELQPDRPENRLLRSALSRVVKTTANAATWRVAHELSVQLSSIPESRDIDADFSRWSSERLLAHYAPVRPWCELVLGIEMPLALHGAIRGRSLLFAMDKLFERYVGIHLASAIVAPSVLRKQHEGEHLVLHAPNRAGLKESNYFALVPDFVVRDTVRGAVQLVLDTKWKRLDSQATNVGPDQALYGLAQSDLYQLFAYGQKYLGGHGDLVLIYPRCSTFMETLPVFRFSDTLRLWIAPFDLETDVLCEFDAALPLRWSAS